ncbi:MAG: DUF1934 domain-containing protein [Lachnospiraceae bacterium]|nr:DUF1934 domain-containing protein [Lachnospiraceae bacterium]
MKKEVLVSICGLQFMDNLDNSIEVITKGDYYNRNEKHYLLFEERIEGLDGITKNIIKFNDKIVDITKKGVANVHMVFEEKHKNMTYYNTPFGNLLIGLYANKIDVEEKKDRININIDYSLDINYQFVSECSIHISAVNKECADLCLQ